MAWVQVITPQEDSTFDTSLGDWLGDGIWDPGPHFTFASLLRIEIPLPNTIYEEHLTYPHCPLPPDTEFYLTFQIGKLGITGGNTFRATITDGVTDFTTGWQIVQGSALWVQSIHDTTPPTWNEANTQIKIEVQSTATPADPDLIDVVRLDCLLPSLRPPDHLPLMGVH